MKIDVWAPHADAVSVVGFDGERESGSTPLGRGDDGWWRGDADLAVGAEYLLGDPPWRRALAADRPARPRRDQLGRPLDRHGARGVRPRRLHRRTRQRVGDLRAPHRHVRRRPARRGSTPRPRGEARGERDRAAPDRRVRGRRVVGVQPGPPVRRRVELRRPRGPARPRPCGPRPRHRRGDRRGRQPPRPERPRSVALRRLARGRRRRHLLLQRRPCRDPVGCDATRLRPTRGPRLPRAEPVDVVPRVRGGRTPLRLDRQHPQRRRFDRSGTRPARRGALPPGDERGGACGLPVRRDDRRGPAGRRSGDRTGERGRVRVRPPVGGRLRAPGASHARGPRRRAPRHRRGGGGRRRWRVAAGRVHREPRRGRERADAGAVGDRPGAARLGAHDPAKTRSAARWRWRRSVCR